MIGVPTDVTDRVAVEALADAAWDRFDGVQVVCLNAGVIAAGHAWEVTDDDWDWVLGVNVRGVAHGIRAFVPRLVEAGDPAHVLVTASMAGIVAAPVSAAYVTSKFAALGLAESLHHDLGFVGADHERLPLFGSLGIRAVAASSEQAGQSGDREQFNFHFDRWVVVGGGPHFWETARRNDVPCAGSWSQPVSFARLFQRST